MALVYTAKSSIASDIVKKTSGMTYWIAVESRNWSSAAERFGVGAVRSELLDRLRKRERQSEERLRPERW